MPQFEFEFNQQDKDLVVSQDVGTFGETDYIRLTIYPTEAINNIVRLNDDMVGIGGKAIFFSTTANSMDINISPFTDGIFDDDDILQIGGDLNDFEIFENPNGGVYIKPNEIFNEFGLPQGEYRIQIDFLNQLKPGQESIDTGYEHFPFIIKQISTSRKEVRLKILDTTLTTNSVFIPYITTTFNGNISEFLDDGVTPNPNYKYQFKHVLNIGTGDHNPIMNYQFDAVTDGKDNQSLILKLYEPLPTNVKNLSMVTIEREVLTTQIQNIFYFSDVPDVFFGDGLLPDYGYNYINPDGNDVGFQNLNELVYSASIGNTEIDSLISSSEYGYPNLNTDFNEFSNHTFFGSAKKKLENFKTKVETIQGYYSEISSSLSVSSSIDGDSAFIIQKREDLFNKIQEEFKTFTPYERFLYYDGQSETTASAPGLGKNYADTVPVQLGGESIEGIELNQHNGFNVVYKHSSKKVSGPHNEFIDLFTDKYRVENKPFFNYSGSIYLSFLMQGDSGSSLTWLNNNKNENPPVPNGTIYQNNILNPDMTGSAYQRYILQASQSYFIPLTANNDMSELSIGDGDFNAGSSKIIILSGSIKTGSAPSLGSIKIKDSTGLYPTNVITQSGVPFYGSIMPYGELFRVYTRNSLSSSLQGYWNIDDFTSGSELVLNQLKNDAVGSNTYGNVSNFSSELRASDGVEVHGRQYGSSYFMTSESAGGGVFIESTNFNFNKEDNFSMAIWAKRFHPNTSSADPTAGSFQGLYMRGNEEDSYGIDYDFKHNKLQAGVRSGSIHSEISASVLMSDDLLNWHHITFTYESGSDTGIKLYVDGQLEASASNIGYGDFSASNPNASNNEKLTLGGNDILHTGGAGFSGFLQYPRIYDRVLTPSEINQLYLHPDGITETKITDVKVSLKDPTDVLPFDNLYHTSSANWTNWYNNMLTKAENFDTDNIHSFENNLPLYIQESSDYNDMKDFLNLQGEQYDLIRNHIDSMGTIHKRGYKKTNSPPNNTLPMLLSNMGWEAINPFSGSLTDTLGSYLSGVTSIDDIKNNTWRKTLNNLLYIYKSKGTKNSVRALLNTYGYPPDVLEFQEFGGRVDEITPTPVAISNQPPDDYRYVDTDLSTTTGSISFTKKKERFYSYRINGSSNRVFSVDHYRNDTPVNTIEFVYKHVQSTGEQVLLEKSANAVLASKTSFDLRLLPSSDGLSSSLEFRLNNSNTASLDIESNAISMSTPYLNFRDGELWNIMLQRMTSSISGSGTNEYRLHASLQDNFKIKTYSYVTMSVSGGLTNTYLTGGLFPSSQSYFANQNWPGSGSYGAGLTVGNLFFGGRSIPNAATNPEITGSIAEIRGWSTALSTSKFRQHTFNKFSTVGNTINSHKDELVYHFKLNENYTTASVSASGQELTIVDSSPTTTYSDFSIQRANPYVSDFTSSIVYGVDYINVIKQGLKDNINKSNDNNIIINPTKSVIGNLNPNKSAIESLIKPLGKKPRINVSPKLELQRSPQSFIDNFILDKLSGFNLETKYGNPKEFNSQSYDEFNTFRKNFFEAHPISVDVNKYIRAHENMFNHSIIEGIKKIVPARSTLSDNKSNFGVTIKPTILEKQKNRTLSGSVELNPNTANGSHSVDINLSETIYESIKEGTIQGAPASIGSYEVPYNVEVSLGNSYTGSTDYKHPPFLQPGGYVTTIEKPYSSSISILPTYDGTGVETSKNGTIDYALIANESYKSIHKDWGRTNNDVQFINFAAGTGSDGTFNTYDIDNRFVFYAVGDNEHYSASFGKSSDFTNSTNFYNRLNFDTGIHSNIVYESYINGNPGNQTGRMMGKTRYFTTSSDGNIILPSNHVTKFNNPFKEQMIGGTQNTNPGFLNTKHEDYSSASFYRVEVTGGEQAIYVKGTNNPTVGNDDKIIY